MVLKVLIALLVAAGVFLVWAFMYKRVQKSSELEPPAPPPPHPMVPVVSPSTIPQMVAPSSDRWWARK